MALVLLNIFQGFLNCFFSIERKRLLLPFEKKYRTSKKQQACVMSISWVKAQYFSPWRHPSFCFVTLFWGVVVLLESYEYKTHQPLPFWINHQVKKTILSRCRLVNPLQTRRDMLSSRSSTLTRVILYPSV